MRLIYVMVWTLTPPDLLMRLIYVMIRTVTPPPLTLNKSTLFLHGINKIVFLSYISKNY